MVIMKKYILILFLFLSSSSFSQTYLDSIPTVDDFGRVRNGIIVQGIVDVMNTDPSGVKLTEPEIAYIRSIVGGMYLAGSWQKSKAVYGFVGGNEWKHKWNWKDMRDLDAAFRIVWVGGITHSSLGAQGNGSTGYGDTKLYASVALTNYNTHLSAYVNNISTTNSIEIGSGDGASNDQFILATSFSGLGRLISGQYDQSSGRLEVLGQESRGYSIGNRTSITNHNIFKNGIKLATSTANGNTLKNSNIYLFAVNYLSIPAANFSNKRMSFTSIGSGLTDQQAIQTSNVVTYSQGILNRK